MAAGNTAGSLAMEAVAGRSPGGQLLGNRGRLAKLDQELDDLVAWDVVATLVRHGEAVLEDPDCVVTSVQLDQATPQELKHLGKLRAQLQRAAKGFDRLLELPVLQEQ